MLSVVLLIGTSLNDLKYFKHNKRRESSMYLGIAVLLFVAFLGLTVFCLTTEPTDKSTNVMLVSSTTLIAMTIAAIFLIVFD